MQYISQVSDKGELQVKNEGMSRMSTLLKLRLDLARNRSKLMFTFHCIGEAEEALHPLCTLGSGASVANRNLMRRWTKRRSRKISKTTPPHDLRLATTKARDVPPSDDKFPVWPPEPPAVIISDRANYRQQIKFRGYDSPRGIFHDRPIDAFYRLYEFFVLDYVYGYRNELEYFWRQHSWAVKDIPDPQDCDPARYAFLACVASLMVQAYNAKIALGLPRNAPHIMSPEQAEEYRNTPEAAKIYEEIPDWCRLVAPLSEPLYVPTDEGVILDDPNDERLQPDLKKKNIFVWSYHVHFT